MKINQKGALDMMFLVALIALLVGAGFAFWRINEAKNTVSNTSDNAVFEAELDFQSTGLLKNDEEDEIDSASDIILDEADIDYQPVITGPSTENLIAISKADDWIKYKNDDLGLTFYYPPSWGDEIRSGDYGANFSASENSPEGCCTLGSHSISLYAKLEPTYYTGSGPQRGGAITDCLGYKKDKDSFFSIRQYVTDEMPDQTVCWKLSRTTLVDNVKSTVLLYEGEFFGTNTYRLAINLANGGYADIVVDRNNEQWVRELKGVAQTVNLQ